MLRSLRDRITRQLVGLVDRHTRTLAAILEASADPILVVDQSGAFAYASDSAARLLGRTTAEILGKSWDELGIPHDEMALLQSSCETAIHTGEPARAELFWLTLDGERAYEYTASPIRGREGVIEAVLLVLRDMTERKQLEQALQQRAGELADQDQQKDDFLLMLSDDLRDPLAALRGAIQRARQSADDPSQRDRQLQLCELQVRQLSNVRDDLLDFSGAANNTLQLQTEPLDLNQLVAAVVEDLRLLTEQAGVELALEPALDRFLIEADPPRLRRAISQLIYHAVSFTRAGGAIQIRLTRDRLSGGATFTIEPVGTLPEMLPHRAGRFARSWETTDGHSCGIGLELVKRLVEQHGGTVEIHSEGSGLASRLRVVLPALPTEPLPPPIEKAARRRTTAPEAVPR